MPERKRARPVAAPPPLAPVAAFIAAQRFGLGEAKLATVGADPRAWLLGQLGAADAQLGTSLSTTADAVLAHVEYLQAQRQRREAAARGAPTAVALPLADHFRDITRKDLRARLETAATTTRPFAERLVWFWANHFSVSGAKTSARGLVGAFEREAIRPHIAGRFDTLLKAAVKHAAMLRYLDNDQSAGAQSPRALARSRRAARTDELVPRVLGLNENLARELLELHTVGVNGGYVQADVTALAKLLTGWRVAGRHVNGGELLPGDETVRFDPAWHEPGPKTVLGKTYAEGAQALDQLLADLATHRATARHLAAKLVRHFVADEPPLALVEQLASRFLQSEGDLGAVYRELLQSPLAWQPTLAKLKTPEEFVVGSARLLGLGAQLFASAAADGGIGALGQRVQAAPSPAGWPDRADDWLGPEAVWKRVEWAGRLGERLGRSVDARSLARSALGSALGENSARQIDAAADGTQALSLLLLCPEFQRR